MSTRSASDALTKTGMITSPSVVVVVVGIGGCVVGVGGCVVGGKVAGACVVKGRVVGACVVVELVPALDLHRQVFGD